MTFCSSSKVAVFSLLNIDVYLCLNMSEDLNQIYCRRSLDMNPNELRTHYKKSNVALLFKISAKVKNRRTNRSAYKTYFNCESITNAGSVAKTSKKYVNL